MGGSGGGSYTNWTPESLSEAVRAEREKSVAEFDAQLSDYLNDLLRSYNDRNAALARERLDGIKDLLKEEVEGTFDQLYGGSVAKHTYVDGLSDVDSLLLLNGSKFEDKQPARILERLQALLQQRLGNTAEVTHGRMAVTVRYQDGMEVQVVPALKTDEGLKVPSSRRDGWSSIQPEAFTKVLTKRNDECGGKLIPTIKLAKAVIGSLPEQYRLSGYHIEALAIAAFRNYDGAKTPTAMLPTFFERASTLVLSPIRDRTGQSIHVDGYLGVENSDSRQYISRLLGNIGKRMTGASAAQSKPQWQALFFNE